MSNVLQIHRDEPEDESSRFEEFWRSYPKRVGKPIAKAKFDAIISGGLRTRTLDRDSGMYVEIDLQATADDLIEGAKRYTKSMIDPKTFRLKDGGKYICHPATWLNQGRWLDE